MIDDSGETEELLNRARQGDEQSLNELFQRYRDWLRRMVELRLDRRLQGRIDPSDVLQEAFLEAATRLDQYLSTPSMPLFLWLRFLVGERLVTLHRPHLGTQVNCNWRSPMTDSNLKRNPIEELAARLHHTNIVPVFGVGEHQGMHYYAMQFIHGLGLDEVLAELRQTRKQNGSTADGRKPTIEAVRVRRQTACKEVSAVVVAESLVTGQFEQTALFNSPDSDVSDRPPRQPSCVRCAPGLHQSYD